MRMDLMRIAAKICGIFRQAPAEKITRAVERGRMPSLFADDLAKVENAQVQEALTKYLSGFANKKTAQSQMEKAQADDIIHKLNLCDDPLVKSKAEEMLRGIKSKNHEEDWKTISKVEHLLDCVNTADKKYSTLYCAEHPIGYTHNFNASEMKHLQKRISKFTKDNNNKKLESLFQLIEEAYSEPRKLARIINRRGGALSPSDMRHEEKFASIREYIHLHPDDKETATYLWQNYFVKSQNPKLQKMLNEIYDEYGVRVCTTDLTTFDDLIYLKEELAIYKSVSKGEAKFPDLLDIRKDYYIMAHKNMGAYQYGSQIVVPHEFIKTTCLRHELAHMVENVLKPSKVRFNENDRQELVRAGVQERSYYFFTNEQESWAVFAEGNMSSYSEAFKQKMITKRKGLPAWIVNLTPHSVETSRLKAMFSGPKNEKIIDKMQEVLGDEALASITTQAEFKCAQKICKEIPEGKKLTPEEFHKLLHQRMKQQGKCAKDAKYNKLAKRVLDSHQQLLDEFNKEQQKLEKQYKELEKMLRDLKNQF